MGKYSLIWNKLLNHAVQLKKISFERLHFKKKEGEEMRDGCLLGISFLSFNEPKLMTQSDKQTDGVSSAHLKTDRFVSCFSVLFSL